LISQLWIPQVFTHTANANSNPPFFKECRALTTLERLLNDLGDRRITIRSEKDNLIVKAPKGAMTPHLASQLRERKNELLSFLSQIHSPQQTIPKAPDDAPLTTSSFQQRLWFIEQLSLENPDLKGQYNLYAALKLSGPISIKAFQLAIKKLGERHITLRMRFLNQNGKPVPVLDPPGKLSLILEHLTNSDSNVLHRAIQQEATFPFQLDRDCLCRFKIFQLSHNEHVLMANLHHIISDGWSMDLLVRDLVAMYAEFAQGIPAVLPPLTVSYLDFAHWQNQPSQLAQRAKHLAWWKETLQGMPVLHQLPTDRPRTRENKHRACQIYRLAPLDILEGLQRLGNAQGASLYMVLLAAFYVLLSKHSQTTDIAVGTVVANRNHAETEPLIGFFVNTLVLRTHVEPSLHFFAFLEKVKQQTLATFAHQEVPFDQVVDALNPKRALNHAPLVQIMFSQQNTPFYTLSLPGLQVEPIAIHAQVSKFDLVLDTFGTKDGLHIGWDFNLDLFRSDTMETMADHFCHLLREVVERPQTPLDKLSLSDSKERNRIFGEWTSPVQSFPIETPVHQHFEAWVCQQPHHPAIMTDDANPALTYLELDQRANQFARMLLGKGCQPEDRIALLMDRSPEMVIAVLGTLKAGCTYVPIDPGYPDERIAYMLADCKAAIVITGHQDPIQIRASWHAFDTLNLDFYPSDALSRPVLSQQAAYMIYTSGSTGRPKAAINSHCGLASHALWQKNQFPLGPEDRVALKAPFSFDVSAFETFWALVSGATLVVVKPGKHGDPTYLRTFFQKNRITGTHFVGSMLKAFLDSLGEQVYSSSLRILHSGGEALTAETQRLACARLSGPAGPLTIENGYGPSETAITVTHASLPSSPSDLEPTIGKPVPNAQAFVVDHRLVPSAIAIPGELLIGGTFLGRGYFERPRLTAERFIPHPFSSEPGQRLYRTGDKVRWLADGNLAFLGRIDSQVKLRGLRIELGEIEALLTEQPQIEQAAVVLGRSASNEKHLVAYLRVKGPQDAANQAPEWKKRLAESLPGFMVPSYFIILDTWPRLPNGKLDRKSLEDRPIEVSGFDLAKEPVLPRTELEADLAAIWCEVLQLGSVGVEDNFFDIGGHSLLATQIISRMHSTFPEKLSLTYLFEKPTIAAIAEGIENIRKATRVPITTSAKSDREDFEF